MIEGQMLLMQDANTSNVAETVRKATLVQRIRQPYKSAAIGISDKVFVRPG